MPKEVYKTRQVYTVDGVEIDVTPLKIKYLKEVMNVFSLIHLSSGETDTLSVIAECVRISMKQHFPKLSKDINEIEDSFDLQTLYKILNYSAGIKLNNDDEEDITEIAKKEGEESNWDDLDLAKLEAEIFLLGIWKNFEELEKSLCLEELMQILSTLRELNFEEKKFTAALQGVDLEGGADSNEVRGQQEWENLKARVASGGATSDANDILVLQGQTAMQAGFGIGMGLSYDNQIDESKLIKKQ